MNSSKENQKIKIEKNWLELVQNLYSMPKKRLDITFILCIVALSYFSYWIPQEIDVRVPQTLIQIYSTVLGFGIGGYAVFAVTSNKEYIVDLVEYEPDTYKLPLYKVHLMVLIKFIIVTTLSLLFFTSVYFTLNFQENEQCRNLK